ncbi:hypothetical protein PAL_GLEAN10017338 [Pteropus alecto]|uniref:Uncharacterized protein n=1 Tax=Pteropus alecto TaxID=9402 RepID=L5K2Q8_PTEAL|nr:hypothetical protein PAL_GLEAN10017338 [Pteropus alecto]
MEENLISMREDHSFHVRYSPRSMEGPLNFLGYSHQMNLERCLSVLLFVFRSGVLLNTDPLFSPTSRESRVHHSSEQLRTRYFDPVIGSMGCSGWAS